MNLIASTHSFLSAYTQADGFGKLLFWALWLLSILSWSLLIQKTKEFSQIQKLGREVVALFSEKTPLALKIPASFTGKRFYQTHLFFAIYTAFKEKTLKIFDRNRLFSLRTEEPVFLSESDLNLLTAQMETSLSENSRRLEKNLFLLSMTSTLGPFLGLLGTAWGMLLTFSKLGVDTLSINHRGMLSDLSMALATTVIGLVVAIPAFAGHSYLKNRAREIRKDMEHFAHLLLTSIELHYRKPEHAQKNPSLL